MPKFLDHHATIPQLSPETRDGIAERIKAGQADEHGVKGLNVFLATDGEAYCLSEAPDAEAVLKSHESVGLRIRREDVIEVKSVV